MASLVNARNVYNTCLLILRERGYELWFEKTSLENVYWYAKKGEYDFAASNPIELLGLVTIYDYKTPQTPPEDYWWVVGDEMDQLLEDFIKLQTD